MSAAEVADEAPHQRTVGSPGGVSEDTSEAGNTGSEPPNEPAALPAERSSDVAERPPSEARLAPLIVLAGATATGKTSAAIRLAEALLATGEAAAVEIISADSRQVYRGLDIGTAKASRADQARVPHHGLDLVDPDEPFSVADFARHATSVLASLAARGGVAILTGGSGLYLRAVGRGIDLAAVPSDAILRARLEEDLVSDGLKALVARLRAAAPTRAATMDLRNPRRVVRALEVALLRGDAPLPVPLGYAGAARWLGLSVDPDRHRRWIASRARGQFEGGLLDEAAALRDRYPVDLRSFSGIGYREAFDVLDGRSDLEAAITANVSRNLRLARHQATWFRAEADVSWIHADDDPVPGLLDAVRQFLARDARPATPAR